MSLNICLPHAVVDMKTFVQGTFKSKPRKSRKSNPFAAKYAAFQSLQRKFPGHAWHEKSLQRQACARPLVRSQERRATVVLPRNRLLTARQLVVNRSSCSSIRLAWDFIRPCFLGGVQDGCFRCSGGRRQEVMPWAHRTASPHSLPDPPRRALPRPAPPVECPGFGFDRLSI